MKKTDIKQLPLLFLFVPTLVSAIVVFLYLNYSFQASYELQFKANARHIVSRITQLSSRYIYNRRYTALKEALQDFVGHSDSAIDNIVVYNQDGQFVTALTLDQRVLNSSLSSYPEVPFFRQGEYYLAFGKITPLPLEHAVGGGENAIGFVRIEFNVDPGGQRSEQNKQVVAMIALITVIIGFLLWRYRYTHFHYQLMGINEHLSNLNKGFKHSRLNTDGEFTEINGLHRQINALVDFYEKRLTMKHFEATELEQKLGEANTYIESKKGQNDALRNGESEPQNHDSISIPLLGNIYRAACQVLQDKLALIDNSMINSDNHQTLTEQQQLSQADLDGTISQLNMLLNEIKRLADISAGELEQQFETILSTQLITSISRLAAPLAHDKGLEFIVCQPANPLTLEVDLKQLQHLLITLIQSAVEATASGYVKLTLEVVRVSDGYSTLCYQIQDSGGGYGAAQYRMLADEQIDPELFEDDWIYQGLSLLVAKKFIESMGGQFKIKSLAGLGSELYFQLDCKIDDDNKHQLPDHQGLNMVIYDPVRQTAEVIFDQLSELGILATLCVDETQVLTALGKGKVDCGIFCRPVEKSLQQHFDQSLEAIIAADKLDECLFLTASPDGLSFESLNLPQSWKIQGKPFILDDLKDYFAFVVQSPEAGAAHHDINHSDRIEILAVDDNETNLKLLSVILRNYPVNLVSALSGREALVMTQKQRFDLILMDKEMPGMDGIETSRHIRQLTLNQQTPIVVFTAHVSDDERDALFSEGINDCMEKPLDEGKFYYLMDNWCEQRWARINAP